MRAAYYSNTGPAREVLHVASIETPEPRPGEVLVRVHASGVNPSDVKARAGARGSTLPFPKIIPHSDGAGTIEAVGDGVDPDRVGQRVWIWNGQWRRAHGTAAEYIAVPSKQAVELPDSTRLLDAACLGIPATTAWVCVFTGPEVRGETVLIYGATGAVGHYAVQFARLAGATVIATASTPEKTALARAAGASHVIDFRGEDVADEVVEYTQGRGVDRIIDPEFGANLASSSRAIAQRGHIFAYGSALDPSPTFGFYPLLFKSVTLHMPLVYLLDDETRLAANAGIGEALVSGDLVHNVDSVVSLDDIATAHERVEGGSKLGVVVVKLV